MKRTRKGSKSTTIEKGGKFQKFCPICQVSFSGLKLNSNFHITNCSVKWDGLSECTDGLNCRNADIFHYRDFSHMTLANYRYSTGEQQNTELFINRADTNNGNTKNELRRTAASSDDEENIFLPKKKWQIKTKKSSSVSDSDKGKSSNITETSTKIIKRGGGARSHSSKGSTADNMTNSARPGRDRTCKSATTLYAPLSDIDGNSLKSLATDGGRPDEDVVNKITKGEKNARKYDQVSVEDNELNDNTNAASNDQHVDGDLELSISSSQGSDKQDKAKADWKLILNGNGKSPRKSGRFKREAKICPSYKKIADTSFAVDAFEFGAIEGVTTYFLTHFHYDHYIGLKKSFKFPLYCTNITAKLVIKRIKVDEKYIHILENNKSIIIGDVEVTPFDANHCPGSVILLFRLRNGKQHLHTGDFRADAVMETHSLISELPVANLYLDTTYFENHYSFPTQKEVIDRVRMLVKDISNKYPKALFVCGAYTIGKEKVFTGIIDELQCKLWCDRAKCDVLRCLEDTIISSAIVDNPKDAKVHVLTMGKINYETLSDYMLDLKNTFSHIFAFRPSGWEMAGTTGSDWTKCSTENNITIYGVPYSEHSSYPEICKFVSFLKPAKIIPTVNVGSRRMYALLKELIDSYSDSPKQPRIDQFISITKS